MRVSLTCDCWHELWCLKVYFTTISAALFIGITNG